MTEKKLITLFELERRYAKKQEEEYGIIIRPEHPQELSPAWPSFCKRNWTAWHKLKEKRYEQLVYLEIHETHEVDYYKTTEPIMPI